MKIGDYPKTLAIKAQYTSGDLAILLGVSLRSASIMLAKGIVGSFTIPGLVGRKIHHDELISFLDSSPDFAYAKAKLYTPEQTPE